MEITRAQERQAEINADEEARADKRFAGWQRRQRAEQVGQVARIRADVREAIIRESVHAGQLMIVTVP